MRENQAVMCQQPSRQTQNPVQAREMYQAALTYIDCGQDAEAIRCLQEAIAIWPDDVNAYCRLGNVLNRQGRSADAIHCYQQGLAICPDSAATWYNLGTALLTVPRLSEAVRALRQAIALQPDFAGAYINLGYALEEQGLSGDALHCYQQGLASCPDSADLWYNLGAALFMVPRLSEAIAALRQAIVLQPDFLYAYICLGNALQEQGLPEEAIQCYQQGLAIYPGNAELWYNLGTDLLAVPRLPEAVQALQQAIALQPDFADAYTNLGNALEEQGLSGDAVQCYQQGLVVCSDNAQLWYNLGTLFVGLQRLSEAVKALQQAVVLQPDFADAYANLGNALQSQGEAEDAIAAYDRAIALQPAKAELYCDRSLAILLSGDLVRGFAEFKWRTQVARYRHAYEWWDDQPQWHGENFSGKRLLVYDEQGFGDVLQFCRYLPLVKARGGSVQFSTKQPLLRLFANFPGIDELVEHTAAAIARTQFDLVVPLLSLPHIFGTTLRTIPASVPYLTVDQHWVTTWQNKVNCRESDLRVGLVWAGSPENIPGRIRTCGLKAMLPLADIPGVTFYSLQTGEAANEANTPLPGMRLIDLTDDIADFADTAALIMNLDLVISVDTAVAHLAGALGKTVWTLLPAAGDWRWLLVRNDTPWYPTMRLFRQSAPGDWNGVMTAVAQELRTLATAKAGATA
ncbi:Beta-barrel assembly-enhancing protease [Sporomusa silvacetica DSM 10669]|uniref:Beta-barrel assembly-enhancing protease n=1 Tax=Sporomusa silvacetica DSM 10669 TaxID=1123289 RepID=A0ABZ3IHC6_9FIRM|nr:tetratricopeptide repeat protein [Sporomusa silvacetica]OZC22064.1 TPR repeat-containing protein YrrB [Sporomusa silvacetica DSM 10669]